MLPAPRTDCATRFQKPVKGGIHREDPPRNLGTRKNLTPPEVVDPRNTHTPDGAPYPDEQRRVISARAFSGRVGPNSQGGSAERPSTSLERVTRRDRSWRHPRASESDAPQWWQEHVNHRNRRICRSPQRLEAVAGARPIDDETARVRHLPRGERRYLSGSTATSSPFKAYGPSRRAHGRSQE